VRVVSLGRTSIEISRVHFGAAGSAGVVSSPPRAQGITHDQGLDRLDEALALASTFIDTADPTRARATGRGEWQRRGHRRTSCSKQVGGSVTDSGDRRPTCP